MTRFGHTLLAVVAVLLVTASCERTPSRPTVTVFAAASTAPLLEEIAERYERATGVHIRLNFASSSMLGRQIEGGAPMDVFISAHPQWMDRLEAADLLASGTRRDYLANVLVFVVPTKDSLGVVVNFKMNSEFDFAAAWPGRIAIGDPSHVPVGVYAKQAMTALGWWDGVADRMIPTADAPAAARLVELGEAANAIVYASDALTNPAITIFATFPPESHDPIVYPAALSRAVGAEARAFFAALFASPYGELRNEYGFTVPGE